MAMRTFLTTMISSTGMSSNFSSSGYSVEYYWNYAIQANTFNGVPVGTYTIQGSLDNVNYSTIPVSSFAGSSTAIATSGTSLFNVAAIGYKYVKLQWTATSGSSNGTLNALLFGKGF